MIAPAQETLSGKKQQTRGITKPSGGAETARTRKNSRRLWTHLLLGSGQLTGAAGGFLPGGLQLLPEFFVPSHQLVYLGREALGGLGLPNQVLDSSRLRSWEKLIITTMMVLTTIMDIQKDKIPKK